MNKRNLLSALLIIASVNIVFAREVRDDRPRLFFNSQTITSVKDRALGREADYYNYIKSKVDNLADTVQDGNDYGVEAAWSAFIYTIEGDKSYFELATKMMLISLDFYEHCFESRVTVNWYSKSRIHSIMAYDWLYNDLDEAWREAYITRFIELVDKYLTHRPVITGEHLSDEKQGMYGLRSIPWFIAITAHGTGIKTETVEKWLEDSWDLYTKTLDYRASVSGKDGGGLSATIDYMGCWYPYAEWNFYFTALSAMGIDLKDKLEYYAMFPNYMFWNLLPTDERYVAYGTGDALHSGGNKVWVEQFLYSHLSIIESFFGNDYPESVQVSNYLIDGLAEKWVRWRDDYFIYAFIVNDDNAPKRPVGKLNVRKMPRARHFEEQGQVFMSSGFGKNDVYCAFMCGASGLTHSHYDSLHFTIFTDNSYLALDSGDRYNENANLEHLLTYFAQSVAHNTILINQPGEPTAQHWLKDVEVMDGGQHTHNSKIIGFEENKDFVYVACDATGSYQHDDQELGQKAELVSRQMVYLPPRHFVIYDRVVSTKPEYKKRWLLHSVGEPNIEGNVFYADHNDNRLFATNLLPKDSEITKIGGKGKEFWSAGRNWELVKKDTDTEEYFDTAGRWRVEISPKNESKTDYYLNVMEVSKNFRYKMVDVELIDTDKTYGVSMNINGDDWVLSFNKEGILEGSIQSKRKNINKPLKAQIQQQSGVYGR